MNDEALESGSAQGIRQGEELEEVDRPTRETCHRCCRISAVGFYSPLWRSVAGEHWRHGILCVACFAALGDERGIVWEQGMKFYPVSLRSHLAYLDEPAAAEGRG